MSISFNKFVPRPGRVNKQGCLPDPSELVCVEVPKVFDQCLIKKCLSYCEGPDTNTTDCELRSNPLENPKIFLGCRDFKISLKSVEKIPIPRKKDYKKLVICYVISFYADYVDCNAVNKSEFFEINREDVIWNFYCPDSVAKMSSSRMHSKGLEDCDTSMIKLEMVADALHGEITKCDDNKFLDITLGYYIVVKCQIIVQLLIPAYDYCPIPKEPCQPEPEENICNRFNKSPVPKFYPNQNLEPLFPESDEGEDEANDDEMNGCDYGENDPME
ncbi:MULTISPECIES: hypothetical protein [Clostridium]|uniref:Uncharacterized protein n=2 Tax=Clostridium TaxID=1485 RepID=D8GI80_CLOLD|nr:MULTISPECIES: hypothetical protein [Clostridium]ADK14942.1 conserved hypothetical protein [Clostridium ljungdahlii DSM 13528]OAA87937.1 hypothetical protein WX45_03421 [Clostridium ljungdahlii DSM 13528]OAA94040.1 hypothetical protein WX73_03610 [Clostridium coskatii]OBR96602.1 hypothetical protein CLCOS_07640 [Clostridium coskatii]